MPIYDYTCRGCNHSFELLVRPGTTIACPSCQGTDLERQFSAFAVKTPEGSRRAADKKIKKEAAVGRQESAAEQREIEEHRKEDF